MTRAVIFGAGEAGRRALAGLDASIQVLAFVDNDSAKHGHFLAGHPIVAPGRIGSLAPDYVVIASMYWKEIVSQLRQLGLREDQVIIDEAARDSAPSTTAKAALHTTVAGWMSPDLSDRGSEASASRSLVSIVLPTRNRAGVLSRAIESVLRQSYGYFELIVVDDGSTDSTAKVLEEFVVRDSRIRPFRHTGIGVSAARNRGLAEARGELIAYLDSDNRWHMDFLMLMLRGFRDETRDTGYAGFNIFDLVSGCFRCVVTPFDYERLEQTSGIDLNVFMHRRSLIALHGGFNEGLTRLVDWEFILRQTRHHPPFVIGCALADYFCEAGAARITEIEPFQENRERMRKAAALPVMRPPRMPGPLRVAFVQYEFPALSQTFVQNEIARAIELGVRVSIFHVRDAFARACVPPKWDVARFASREELARLLTARGIDLVHTHFAVPHPVDYIIPVCERLALPFTVKPHAFDIFRRDLDPRHHIAGIARHELCRAVFCEGEYHRRFLCAQGVPEVKLTVARNVFEIETFQARRAGLRSTVRRLVSISRFVEKKGFHLLVPAFRALEHPGLRLDLFGFGEDRERIEALAEGDERIRIHDGPRTPSEAADRLADADLFVLPCIEDRHGDTDGLPTVLMEAMAAGVLVVTTPIASTPDLVRHGETGILVEVGSIPALVQGLRDAIAMPVEQRGHLVASARAHLETEFSPEMNARRLLAQWRAIVPQGEAMRDADAVANHEGP